jgi:hypothetical protein
MNTYQYVYIIVFSIYWDPQLAAGEAEATLPGVQTGNRTTNKIYNIHSTKFTFQFSHSADTPIQSDPQPGESTTYQSPIPTRYNIHHKIKNTIQNA